MPAKDLPTVEQFKKDTYVLFGIRSGDKILSWLDQVLALYHERQTEGFTQPYLLADLFFTANCWLQLAKKKDKSVNTGRTKGVQALFERVVGHLCDYFGVTSNVLPRELEKCFGREMSGHGEAVDYNLFTKFTGGSGTVEYLKRIEVQKYLLHFRKGLAYRWSKNFLGIWTFGLADTAKLDRGRGFSEGYAGFVMSMSREIYVSGRHQSTGNSNIVNFFHSSYLSGGTVMCAGSIAIKNGKVLGIRNDSGHYKPTLDHVVNVLECLRMHGVPLANVEILDYDGDHVGPALEVLQKRGKIDRMRRGKQQFQGHLKDRSETLKGYKDNLGLEVKPYRKVW